MEAARHALRSILTKKLVQRYPFVFSPIHVERVKLMSTYVPIISKSLASILEMTTDEDTRLKARQLVKDIHERVLSPFQDPLEYNFFSNEGKDLSNSTKGVQDTLNHGLYALLRDYLRTHSCKAEIFSNTNAKIETEKAWHHPPALVSPSHLPKASFMHPFPTQMHEEPQDFKYQAKFQQARETDLDKIT
ncbi:uncharacterized protein VTP21DRAFT_8332 [Calcarisporiella thermophila]|uniref:uncharacterized protein n=1 Tax=Calcarisporiella thermophila TaxID=911321 RepID=UPI003743E072